MKLFNYLSQLVICHGIIGSCHEGVVDLIASWSGRSCRLDTKLLWSMIPHFLMWVIWRERNTRTFEGDERWIDELKLFFLQTSLEWANALGFVTFMSFPDMLIFVPSLLFRFFLCCLLVCCLCALFLFFFFFFLFDLFQFQWSSLLTKKIYHGIKTRGLRFKSCLHLKSHL